MGSLDDGFILLSRSIVDSAVFQNEKWLKVWIWCLMEANFKDRSVPVRTGKSVTVVDLKRGQFIFGRNRASKLLKIKPATLQNIMEKLKKLGNIITQSFTHYSIVTISNYNEYQNMMDYLKTGQPSTNHQPTINQPSQQKERKERKEEKTNGKIAYSEAFERWWKIYPKRNGRVVGKQKTYPLFNRILKSDYQDLKKATINYSKQEYIKDPERFLKDGLWRDFVEDTETQSEKPTIYRSA